MSNELAANAERAAPFYHHYWDRVATESSGDNTVAVRNTVVAAIVDLLCFAKLNNVDSDVIIAYAQKQLLDLKMRATFDSEETVDS